MSSKPKPPKLVRQTANKETYKETHGLASYLKNFKHTGRILKINKKKNLAKM